MKNLLLFLLACSLGAAAAARPIRGSVKCGGKPMGGVTVTDGYTFAQSDEQGIFTLDADDQALFISLVTPSGYLAPLDGGIPQFYRAYDPAAKRYDFELQPWPGSGECYELLAIADPQPKTEEHFRRLRSEVMPALQAATDNGRTRGSNQAAIVLGDIVWDSPELFAGVKAEFAGLGVPVYGVIGNHDHDLNKYTDREATENYRRHFGPTYYAFDMGRTHYIVLDDIVYHGAKKYEEQIDTMQLRWAAAYAERLPAGSRVCIAMHAPAMKSWLGNRVMESAETLMDAFAGHEIHFISGHTHINSNFDIREGAMEHNVAQICGNLWRDPINRDGTLYEVQVLESSGQPLLDQAAQRIVRLARRQGIPCKLVFEVHDLWPLSPIELGGMSPKHPFIMLCQAAGINPLAGAMSVSVCASGAFVTPFGTAPNLLVWEAGGYSVKDYLKCGFPMLIIFGVVIFVFI